MIDWARVQELHDEIGADAFPEIVDIFLEEADEVVARLRDRTGSEGLEEDLHFLKGSALSIGFSDLSDLCQTGERLSAEGQADAVDVSRVVQVYAAAKTMFLEELPTRLPT